jgi:DNA (cytosine-5)-methyltransferase 1
MRFQVERQDVVTRIWLEKPASCRDGRKFSGLAHGFVDVTDRPSETIMAGRSILLCLEDDGKPLKPTQPEKPPYLVPSMAEVMALPPNGYRVISTFAGAGGSSTGYRMAGFKVIWANEFVTAARETYGANMDSATILDGRDIREVDPAEILEATGLEVGELDVLDGSPPCASFSTAGKGAKEWGKVRSYSDTSQRTDDLFLEYARLVAGLKPKVFVAENVSGNG